MAPWFRYRYARSHARHSCHAHCTAAPQANFWQFVLASCGQSQMLCQEAAAATEHIPHPLSLASRALVLLVWQVLLV